MCVIVAAAGSSECSKKPPCTVHHYTHHQTPCVNGQVLSVCLSVCLSVYVCLFVCLSVCASNQSCSFVVLFVSMYLCLCVCLQTQKVYSWLSPKLCVGGVSLPRRSVSELCSPCNPGMQRVNGVCEFCPARQHSDGLRQCTMCPGSSEPQTVILYKFWDNLPATSNLSSFCLSVHGQSITF